MTRPTAAEVEAKSARNRAAKATVFGLGPECADTQKLVCLDDIFRLPDKKWKQLKSVDQIVNAPKYRNQRTQVDGITFDSKKEAVTYGRLKLAEKMGELSELDLQVKFALLPAQARADGTKERPVAYIADFTYVKAGKYVVVDCKGMRTPAYILKRKMMLHFHGITIQEV